MAIELLFEFLVRPPEYEHTMQTDKAFSPATARHVNFFHLFCESLALIFYLPQIICPFQNSCRDGQFLPSHLASPAIAAVTSPHDGHAALGRFMLSLTFLRTFGLVRHWKQMWINSTYENRCQESCTFHFISFLWQYL